MQRWTCMRVLTYLNTLQKPVNIKVSASLIIHIWSKWLLHYTLSDKTYCMPYNTKYTHVHIHISSYTSFTLHYTCCKILLLLICCLHCLKQFCKHLAMRCLGLYIQQCRETCSIVITNGLQIKDPTNLLEMYRILPTLANDKWWIVFQKKTKKKTHGQSFYNAVQMNRTKCLTPFYSGIRACRV